MQSIPHWRREKSLPVVPPLLAEHVKVRMLLQNKGEDAAGSGRKEAAQHTLPLSLRYQGKPECGQIYLKFLKFLGHLPQLFEYLAF